MILLKPKLDLYIDEINELYDKYLSEVIKGVTHFGLIEKSVLLATSSVKCYCGHWYLRGVVVKPEYRGRGMQRELMKKQLEFLSAKTNVVRASIYPDNVYSINNVLKEGFELEKQKKLKNNKTVNVYKRII